MTASQQDNRSVAYQRVDWTSEQLRAEVAFLRRWVVDAEGRMCLLPAKFYLDQSPTRVAMWGIMLGLFIIPTAELVAWLHRSVICGRRAIEVGAGLGDLARFLGIPATDSYHISEDPGVRQRFGQVGHPVPQLREEHTERLTAQEAVAKYRPEVVIAGWSVEKSVARAGPNSVDRSWGIDECAIVASADYCILGHTTPHSAKPVLQLPHAEIQLPGHVSRALNRAGNRIWLFSAGATRTLA